METPFEVAMQLMSHGCEFLVSELTELYYLSYDFFMMEAEISVETVEFHLVLTPLIA
jgi:hypothetical protein